MNFIKKHKKAVLMATGLVLVMLVVCGLFYQPMMKIFENPQGLRQELQSHGLLGIVIFIGIMTMQVIFVFLPGEIVEVMAGFIYGPIGGMFACMIGSAIGSIIIYSFVKKFGLRFVNRFVGGHKIQSMPFLQNKEKLNILCFLIFFIPGTPKDILTYFIPLTSMKLSTFLFITTIARIPSIITSTIGGYTISNQDYITSVVVFTITGIISLFGIWIYKRINQKEEKVSSLENI